MNSEATASEVINMETAIKICGLKREIDIEYANRFAIDFVGFVFYPPSSRYVTCGQALKLREGLRPRIRPFGVFLDNSYEEVLSIARSGAIDVIQLHGATSDELVHRLRPFTDLPIIQAYSIETPEDVKRANASEADGVLLDHGPGGGGVAFDWSLLNGMTRKYFLAGGLTPENVEEAINMCHPYAVDVSSGVETDKLKDPVKIQSFVEKVRRIQ